MPKKSTRLNFKDQARVYEYMKPRLRVLDEVEGIQYAEWINEDDNDYKVARDLDVSTTSVRHIRESAFGILKPGAKRRGAVAHTIHLEAVVHDLIKRVEFLEKSLGVGGKKK